MNMQSMRRPARKSQSTSADRKLRIEDIKAAFTRAGLERDYRTLVETLGENTLARTMTQRWLDLTIRDLLAEACEDANELGLTGRGAGMSG
jgi:hypothetical protein